jgi:hypothetical protein
LSRNDLKFCRFRIAQLNGKRLAGRASSGKTGDRVVRASATVVAVGALSCAACCVLPFALPAAILTMTGGALAWLGRLVPIATAMAALIVANA